MAEYSNALTSILFSPDDDLSGRLVTTQPDTFVDLNLDQLVSAVLAGREAYELAPFFYTPLTTTAAVCYRHSVLGDLRSGNVAAVTRAFARQMQQMREQLVLAQKLRYVHQRERVFLDAVLAYVGAVGELCTGLMVENLASVAMVAFRDELDRYVSSPDYSTLATEAERARDGLNKIEYEFLIDGGRVSVSAYQGEVDYSASVEATFAKFKQGEVDGKLTTFADYIDMNHVEAGILGLVADVFPNEFGKLDQFFAQHQDYLHAPLALFDREVQFYLAYDEYLQRVCIGELRSCLPTVSAERTGIVSAGFDLALAGKLAGGSHPIVTNDFSLTGLERILVVTGANQGGKTTFARTFGQVHYLASLGLPVAGRTATVHLFDRLFTHFERQEDLANLSGKLEDDLVRVHFILEHATGDSIVIMNEIFTSTTLQDAVFLGTEILQRIVRLDALCVCVTFVDELSVLGPTTVSMVAEVDPDDAVARTFHVVRRPADGLAHASAIADRYGLSYPRLIERITP